MKKTETTRQQKNFLIATLLATLLLGFQNCSSSVYMLTTAKPVSAKTDFNEILSETESQINETKNSLKNHNQFEATQEAMNRESRTVRNQTGVTESMTTGSRGTLNFIRKVTKRAPTNAEASAKSKK